ncbi:MAG: signal peptidase II [Burkholderiaceae bacterium]
MPRPDDSRPGAPSLAGTAAAPSPARWYALALAVVIIDQLTKLWVLDHFAPGERLPVIPGLFDLTLLFNPGAAFSFLGNASGWQRWFFTALGLGASAVIAVLLHRHRGQTLFSLALAMIMGGAVGNVIDRLIFGKVVDFLLFYRDPWYFPAFNAADSAITLGAALLIVDELIRLRRHGA